VISPLSSPARVRALLSRHGIRLKKSLGQNILVDANSLSRILQEACLDPQDMVLEIGAGIGTLTQALAGAARKVVAVEIDAVFLPLLQKTLARNRNVEVVHADFLALDLPSFLTDHFGDQTVQVVANLPYYITSPLLERLLQFRHRFRGWTLLVQKEVALRLTARPGTKNYGSLTVFVQYATRPRIVFSVSRHAFFPPPKVDSALVRFEILPRPAVAVEDESLFFAVVRGIFQMRRKTLLNALTGATGIGLGRAQVQEALFEAGFDPSRRGETLPLEDMAHLANTIASLFRRR